MYNVRDIALRETHNGKGWQKPDRNQVKVSASIKCVQPKSFFQHFFLFSSKLQKSAGKLKRTAVREFLYI